jgi:hypothetical protein
LAAGCAVSVVILLAALGTAFAVAPYLHLRGRIVADIYPPGVRPTLPEGVTSSPVLYGGRPATVYVLRWGNRYWAVHLLR